MKATSVPFQNPWSDLSVMLPCSSYYRVKDYLLSQIHKDGRLDGGNLKLCSPIIVMTGIMPLIAGSVNTGDAVVIGEKTKAHFKEQSPYDGRESIKGFLDSGEVRNLLNPQGFPYSGYFLENISEIPMEVVEPYPESVKGDVVG